MTTREPTVWWYVYKGVNPTRRLVYHGVALDPVARADGFHCRGSTKVIGDWKCEQEGVKWTTLSRHLTQEKATAVSHALERGPSMRGYTNIKTGGV